MPKYAGLRDLLRPCMEGVDDPFSDAGEHVVYMRFYATAQSVLTDHLIGPESVSDTLMRRSSSAPSTGCTIKSVRRPRINDDLARPSAPRGARSGSPSCPGAIDPSRRRCRHALTGRRARSARCNIHSEKIPVDCPARLGSRQLPSAH